MPDRLFFLATFCLWLIVVAALIAFGMTGDGAVSRSYYVRGLLGSLLSLTIAVAIAYPINRFLRSHDIKFERKDEQDKER